MCELFMWSPIIVSRCPRLSRLEFRAFTDGTAWNYTLSIVEGPLLGARRPQRGRLSPVGSTSLERQEAAMGFSEVALSRWPTGNFGGAEVGLPLYETGNTQRDRWGGEKRVEFFCGSVIR